MANIYDIAKEAGVSRSTVSRVLNDHPSVSDDKRQRVQAAIDKLKYTPSATARALATSKTNTIGVVTRELAQSFYDEFIGSIHYGADSKNYGVLYAMNNAYMHIKTDITSLMSKKVDGYMFVGEGTVDLGVIEDLTHNQIPFVCYEFNHDTQAGLYININNRKAAYDAVAYLNELGHHNTIHLTYRGGLQEMKLREEGYYDAVRECDMGTAKVFDVDFVPVAIHKACQAMIPYIRENHVTAAFCANNVMASYLMEVLITEGFSVPENFSVIGFDDTPVERPIKISRQLLPEITSIKQPQRAMAEYGVEMLVKAIESRKMPKPGNRVFDCEMIIRDSTGPAYK